MKTNFISPLSITPTIMGKFNNVLLIDDDEDCLFLTRHSLLKLGLFERVDALSSVQAALDFITANCIIQHTGIGPDVIFVDNQMQGMDGFDFLEELNNIPGIRISNFQIYMVSAFTNDADKEKLKKYNVQGFINKPLSLDKLKVLFN
ncbi:MAG TPA: response regulator [Ferruginibacter sp.]|nr:response regulator [Ferruginibacter sp.]